MDPAEPKSALRFYVMLPALEGGNTSMDAVRLM